MLSRMLRKVKSQVSVKSILFGILLTFSLIIFLDRGLIIKTLREAYWPYAGLGLMLGLLSTIFWGFAYLNFSNMFNIQMPPFAVFSMGYISNAAERLISTSGAVSTSLRILMARRYKIKVTDIIAVSTIHTYISFLVPFILLPITAGYVLLTSTLTYDQKSNFTAGVMFLEAVFLIATCAIFVKKYRSISLKFLHTMSSKILKKDLTIHLEDFEKAIQACIQKVKSTPNKVVAPSIAIFLEWICVLGCVFFCLRAFGVSLPIYYIVAGFFVSISLGLIVPTPGGLGVQEGAFVLIFSSMGASFEQVFLSAVLFRLIYSFVPFVLSFAFARAIEVDNPI